MATRCGSLFHNERRCAVQVWHCESLGEWLLGFTGQTPLPSAVVLRFAPARLAHTFGLRQAVDLVFADRAGRVLRCVRALPPRRWVMHPPAGVAWAMRAGLLESLGVEPGSRLATAADALCWPGA